MLIGIDASRANRKIKSGTEYYSYYLIKNLAKIDSHNQYILYTDRPLEGGLLDLLAPDKNIKHDGVPQFNDEGEQIIKSPYNNFRVKILKWPLNRFWTMGRLSLEMFCKQPDILFVPAHSLPLIVPSRSINTLHDVAFEKDCRVYDGSAIEKNSCAKNKLINNLVNLFTWGKYQASPLDHLRWSSRWSLKKAKVIITVSHSSKNEIIDFYHLGAKQVDKIKVIYNGFNNTIYRQIDDQIFLEKILKKYSIKKPYILYVGRLEKKKNTPALIEAFASCRQRREKGVKLVLLGFESFGANEVKYLINDLEIENDVIMPGWIEEADIPYLYNGAEAFIFPSKHEGFGIPVVQAMACGIPVACSNIPVLREVSHEAALFFDSEDVNSISTAIDQIITDSAVRKKLVAVGIERAKDFSWEKCARETLELINNC